MQIKRSQAEIDDVRNIAVGHQEAGTSAYRGLSYEDGVEAVLSWLFGETDDPVFEDKGEDEEDDAITDTDLDDDSELGGED